MNDEKLRILEMIKNGTLAPSEGLELLEALGNAEKDPSPEPEQMTNLNVPARSAEKVHSKIISAIGVHAKNQEECCCKTNGKPRWLYIKVEDKESGKNVNIKIPIGLAKSAMKFLPREAREEMKAEGVDFDIQGLLESITAEGPMNLVEVSEGDNKVVRIYTE
jgi:hypothetical protein